MYNLYSPTWRILTAYRQQFPRENFHRIREFLNKMVPDAVAGTSGETVRGLDTRVVTKGELHERLKNAPRKLERLT